MHATPGQNEPLDALQPKALFEFGKLRTDQPVYLICRTGVRSYRSRLGTRDKCRAGHTLRHTLQQTHIPSSIPIAP